MNRSMIPPVVKILGLFILSKIVLHAVNAQSNAGTGLSKSGLTLKLQSALDMEVSRIQNKITLDGVLDTDETENLIANLEEAVPPFIMQVQGSAGNEANFSEIKNKAISKINSILDDMGITDSDTREIVTKGISALLENIQQRGN